MSSHLPLSASPEQKLLMICALTQLLSLCLSNFKFLVPPPSVHPLCDSPTFSVFFIRFFFVPHLNYVSPVSSQTSSPAALRPHRAPLRHHSPRCQRSASPRRWGSAHWGRFPCPKTSSTNRPWRRQRGRICPTHPTPRGSGAVKNLHFPTTQ